MKNNKLLPIVAVILIVVAGGIYMLVGNKGKGGGGVIPGIKNAGNQTTIECKLTDKELCRYMQSSVKMADSYKTGFTGTSVMTDKAGKKTETVWQMQDDKSSYLTKENGKEVSYMIMIGNTSYTKDMTDGKWTKFTYKTEGEEKNPFSFNPEEMKSQFKDVIKETEDNTTYKALGKERCGDLNCFKYEIVNPLNEDSKQYIYFDDREYLMRKMRIEMKDGSVTETLFDFKAVTIKEPSPIKEEATNDMKFDNSLLEKTGNMDKEEMQNLIEQYKNMGQEEAQSGE